MMKPVLRVNIDYGVGILPSNDPRFIQCIYCYRHVSKRFVEVEDEKLIILLRELQNVE